MNPRLRDLFLGCTACLIASASAIDAQPAQRSSPPRAGSTARPVPAVGGAEGSLAMAYVQPGASLTRLVGPSREGVDLDSILIGSESTTASSRPVAKSRTRPGTTLPWVGAVEWGVPDDYGADAFNGLQATSRPWAYFEEELEAARVASIPPDYVGLTPLPLFPVFAAQESDFSRKLKRLARAKLYREVRHRLKSEWKSVFLNHPSLTYSDYEQRLFQINNIGKDVEDRDDFGALSNAAEVKQSFFGLRRADGESDIPLVAWGPFTIKDSGALKFDLGRAASADAEEETIEVGDERRVPLVATRDCEVQTAFNFDVDPFRSAMSGDARDSVRRAGISVEVSWLSDVLGRELFSTEVDLETDLYGDFKGFFSFVIKSR